MVRGSTLPYEPYEDPATPDFVCFSHLRWDFVTQRPQHLLKRAAKERRTFFVEEPVFDASGEARLEIGLREEGVFVVVPHLPPQLAEEGAEEAQRQLIDALFSNFAIRDAIFWYYTPMALAFSRHLKPRLVVYDCMDELSAFEGSPPALREHEAELFNLADLVFTGGQSLFEAKRNQHPSVYLFPSSIDRGHFARARGELAEPADQKAISGPRLGFFGVIDERFDALLLKGLAAARPGWNFVIVGPVVKIDPATLPQNSNVHYLGGKSYHDLPLYLSGWQVAMLPFAHNASTRFISPTKTPEYLAAGKPVVSTSIRDVVRPYGEQGLVRIADTVPDFVRAAEAAMRQDAGSARWLARVDAFLAGISWDRTWERMRRLIRLELAGKQDAIAGAVEGRNYASGD
jgi:UDP-galactopyranose mutase